MTEIATIWPDWTDTPKPGSDAALDAGCACAVLDNNHGHWAPVLGPDGEDLWWVTLGCPVHYGKEPE